ncbi:hypothetical protein AAC387_Pa02g5042 [Persea americana]
MGFAWILPSAWILVDICGLCEAALSLECPGEHRGGEFALRLDVEEDPKVEELEKIHDTRIVLKYRGG